MVGDGAGDDTAGQKAMDVTGRGKMVGSWGPTQLIS